MPTPPEGYVNPRSARGNQGCWSCRFRKKKCQRTDQRDAICDDCRRFNMECIGSGDERPRRPGLSRAARDVLKEWIKQHTKEAPDPTEPPLSIRYLWETPTRLSTSSQRGSQEVTRDHRRSSSATSIYSTSSQSHGGRSSQHGHDTNPVSTLILENYLRGGGGSPSPSPSQTASVRHVSNISAQRGATSSDFHVAQYSAPRQQQASMAVPDFSRRLSDPNVYSTMQIQNQPSHSSTYLSVPGVETVSNRQPQMIITDEQGTSYNPNATAAVPFLITSHVQDYAYQDMSPISASYLSPSSPYASSILSSGSSLDDGSWEQGPPSPGYINNDAFFDSSQSSTLSSTMPNWTPSQAQAQAAAWYQQPQGPTYPTR